MKIRFGTRLLISLALLGFLSTACQNNKDEAATVTFTQVYTQTLSGTFCKNCHIPGGSAWTNGVRLDFSTKATAFNTLMSVLPTGSSSIHTCGQVAMVSAGSPSLSYLAGVVVNSYNTPNFAGVTGCTPINDHVVSAYASPAEQTAILTWIQNGAKND